MSRPPDLDIVTALAARAAASSGEMRAVYLAEIECLLAQTTRDADADAIRAEVRRLSRVRA